MTEKEILGTPYVRSSTASLRDVVVVMPGAALDHIVPLQGEPSPIVSRAKEQHAVMVRTFHQHGIRIHPLEENDETGLATFVGDCAIVVAGGAILLRPYKIERRRELAAVQAKLEQLGVPILGRIEAPGLFDGGDVVVAGDTAYFGVPHKRPRSNALGRDQLSRILASCGLKTAELAMNDTVPRLNDVFSAAADDTVVAAPDFVDTAPLNGKVKLIAIPRGDEYGASLLALAPRRVMANLRFAHALPI
ncbi:MAG: hypothetical protein ACREJX_18815, partial [Polyangiaceae bacterium]